METCLRIEGGVLLDGEVEIAGSKNLCVALIPAALLSQDIVILDNIPPISDVEKLIKMLNSLHVTTDFHDGSLVIDARHIQYNDLMSSEMSELRASYYFYSVMLGLFSHLRTIPAGGCRLGQRPVNLHLDAFTKMGVVYTRQMDGYDFKVEQWREAIIDFPTISVGATINVAMLALFVPGKTIIKNAALEPEVTELLKFLVAMGAHIENVGQHDIIIEGGHPLHGCRFGNIPDRIEVGTYALIGASCAREMRIKNVIVEHIKALLNVFDLLEVDYHLDHNDLIVRQSLPRRNLEISTAPFPGFPTDLQQPLTAYLAIGQTESLIQENIYSNRFAHVKELIKMGANICVKDQFLYIRGVPTLHNAQVDGYDLRGGASLVLACLNAKGVSVVRGLKYINRGYDNIVTKLKKLHANIQLINLEDKIDEN